MNWISVKDELPKERILINIATNQGVTSGIYGGDGLWIDKKTGKIIRQKDITHFQPLPKPPKEKK